MIRFKCPTCATELTVENQTAGLRGTCTVCNGPIQIPEVDSPDCAVDNHSAESAYFQKIAPFNGVLMLSGFLSGLVGGILVVIGRFGMAPLTLLGGLLFVVGVFLFGVGKSGANAGKTR